jgi:hypothetical protein
MFEKLIEEFQKLPKKKIKEESFVSISIFSGFLLKPALKKRFVEICRRNSLTLQQHFIHSVS